MTFDDQLKRAYDTLTDRVRGEIERQVQAMLDELAASAVADRESAVEAATAAAHQERKAAVDSAVASAQADRDAAVEAALASARSERDRAVEAATAAAHQERKAAVDSAVASAQADRDATVEAALASARAERDRAVEAATAAAQQERKAAVDSAVASAQANRDAAVEAALASARSERDRAVEAALASARSERDRAVEAALAAVRSERDAAIEAARAEAAAAAPSEQAAVEDHLAPVAAGVRAMSQAHSLTDILDALVTAAASSGATGSHPTANANIWLVRGEEVQLWRHGGTSAEPTAVALDADRVAAEAVRSKTPIYKGQAVAWPLTIAGEVVAVLVMVTAQPLAPIHGALGVLALYASRALEAITAFRTVQAVTQSGGGAPHAAPSAPPTDQPIDEEHASAKRYAKLLVSEIKLYHEADVVDGRRDRDLMLRLGGEIARARVMYEQRVPPHIRQQADYFHDELVRTLANGDAALLEARS